MADIRINKNEATAARRRVYFFLVGTDGITPATGEAGGQPQVSVDGGAWTSTGIGTLTHIGNGVYYADLSQSLVNVDNAVIRTRYKSVNTAECPGDTAIVDVEVEQAAACKALLEDGTFGLAAIETLVDDLESRLTATRAGYLDELPDLDVAVSTLLDRIPSALTITNGKVTVATNEDKTGYSLTSDYEAAKTALAASAYTPPDNAGIAAIKAKTDNLSFSGTDVKATLDGEKVTVATNEDKTGYSLTSAYDAAKTAAQQTLLSSVAGIVERIKRWLEGPLDVTDEHMTLYDDDGTTPVATLSLSDDGTRTRRRPVGG